MKKDMGKGEFRMKNILETECVTKEFKGHEAVSGVSLQVPECCVYGLLGDCAIIGLNQKNLTNTGV